MSVVDNKPDAPRSSASGEKKKGIGAWVKKNKVAAGAIGIGGVVLLMAHKGGKTEGSATESQQAIEAAAQERAALNAGIVPAAVPSAPGNAGEGSSSGGTSGTTAPTANAPAGTEAAPTTTDPALTTAIEGLGGDIAGLTQAQKEASESAGSTAGTTKTAQKAAAKKKPAGKKATKPDVTKTSHHAGQTVNGRFFAGATGVTLGPVIKNAQGTHRTVTVKYGGRTETLISHNGGKQWTDNAPGHTPPSRGPAKHTTAAPTTPHPKPAAHRQPAKKPAKKR